MGLLDAFSKKKNQSDPRKEMYKHMLEKARADARKEKANREINALKKLAQEQARREVLKPSKMERLAKLGENMQQAQKDYEKFFAPAPERKKKYDIPDYL